MMDAMLLEMIAAEESEDIKSLRLRAAVRRAENQDYIEEMIDGSEFDESQYETYTEKDRTKSRISHLEKEKAKIRKQEIAEYLIAQKKVAKSKKRRAKK